MTTTTIVQIDVFTVNHSVCASLPNPGLSNSTMRLPLVTRARNRDDERHREGRDQRVDPEHRRDESVGQPDQQARADAEQDRGHDVVVDRELGGDDAREDVGRTDREVDPAGHQHERPGRRDDQRVGLLVEDVEQVDLRQEGVARQREDDEEDRERDEDPGLPEPGCAEEAGQAGEARVVLLGARVAGQAAIPPAEGSANAAARIADSVIESPSSSATSRPARITSTRWARPRISSSSEEMRRIARPSAASETSSS